MKKILVIGSLNMDFVINVDEMPKKGETIMGIDMVQNPGGKGANQAYALGKLGGASAMIGAVGKDSYGEKLIMNLESVNVDTSGIKKCDGTYTGNAFVYVDRNGENSITVMAGANHCVTTELIDENIELIKESDIVIMQLEIPLDTAVYAAKRAFELGKTVILDPAPAPETMPEEIFKYVDFIKPNETELMTLTGMATDTEEEIEAAGRVLLEKGAKAVIVTLGEKGSMLINEKKSEHFPGKKVKTVDTTAAGDSFTAAFAIALAEGKDCREAIEYGSKVSAIVVTRKGAQASIPTREEVEEKEEI